MKECLNCGYERLEGCPEGEEREYPSDEREKEHLASEAYGSDDERGFPSEKGEMGE